MLGCALTAGCSRTPPVPSAAPPTAAAATLAVGDKPRDLPGVHNVLRVSDKLISGGVPEGDEGFETLQRLGVRTIISVDGAKPEVERARRLGLRYVHLPIGYSGVPREQGLRLARAVRDLPGQVFIHCHHGKHRSPAAAAAILRCLDERCTAAMALNLLKNAGTGQNYQGLHAASSEFSAIPSAELDQVAADFPETAPVGMFVQLMVAVGTHWDHLKLIRTAGWQTPPKHPDLNPAHEALLLREAYHESASLGDGNQRAAEMHAWLLAAEKNAQHLEDVLRAGKLDAAAAEKAYQLAAADCAKCHAKYRDVR